VTAVQRFFASGLLSGTTWGRLLLLFPDAKGLVQWLAAAMPDQALRDLTEVRPERFLCLGANVAPEILTRYHVFAVCSLSITF
jgi:hypothetical protein